MKIDLATYIPFQHQNLEFKRGVVSLAKSQPPTFEGRHTSVLMYVNIVDYITYHLIENLGTISYLITHHELNGIIYFKGQDSSELPLGNKIKILQKFEFPDKASFINDLTDFIKLRNKYVHGLLMLTPDEVSKIDTEFVDLARIAEKLINTYDTIVRGVTDTWGNYLNRVIIRSGASAQASNQTTTPTIDPITPVPTTTSTDFKTDINIESTQTNRSNQRLPKTTKRKKNSKIS